MKAHEEANLVRKIDRVAMFLIGTINNLPYVIGIASAKRIVAEYNKPTYLGLVLWANTFSGVFARFLNTWMLSCNVSYDIGFILNCIAMLTGLIGCAFSKNFWLTLVCVFFIGFSSNYGESVILCYMTFRRKQVLLKSWSSGTGMAGIIGASYSLLCILFTMSYFWSFIAVSPIVIIYFVCFFYIVKKSPDEVDETRKNPLIQNLATSSPSGASAGPEEPEEHISMCNFGILKGIWWFIFNCGSVYFLEYVIQSAYADCSLTTSDKKKYYYSYPLLNLMYQIGVFISRSSLTLFEFPWVGYLTLAQLIFFVQWLTQSLFHWMPFGALIPCMCLIGLCGGTSYVNVFHLIMTTKDLSKKAKEMATSWNSLFISLFIIFAALFTELAESTFLKSQASS